MRKQNNFLGVDFMQKEKANLNDLIRKEKLQYFKDWRSRNKEKIKNYNKTYWERKCRRKLSESIGENNE